MSAVHIGSISNFCLGGFMPTGPVKWFDSKKGFGFIVGPSGQDVFVHFSSIDGEGFRALRDGETVEYELTSGAKGFAASHVRHLMASKPAQTQMQA
jgi:cold shock protein